MKNKNESFVQSARDLHVQPPRSAWKRVESRLEAQAARRGVRIVRILSYAAAAGLLIMLMIAGLYTLNQPELSLQSSYSHSLEDLKVEVKPGESIFDVQKVQSLSEIMRVAHEE